MKILYPLLEIIITFIVLIYIPNKLFNFTKLLFNKNNRKNQLFIFIKENILGLFIGVAITIIFSSVVGSSLETIIVRSVRNAIHQTQRVLGWDEMSICITGTKREFGWSADSFAQELREFNMLEHSTLSKRQVVLSEGQTSLLVHRDYSDRSELLQRSLERYCEKKIDQQK